MKNIIKRIICFILVLAITIVSFGSVVDAAEYQSLYSVMYFVNDDDVLKTPFNDEHTLNNFSVKSKEVTGNEKHYLTWDNSNVLNYTKYKVEVYAELFIQYKDPEKFLTQEQLDNSEWKEFSLPAIHCVDVDAFDCGTVINFSDIKSTYINVKEQDYSSSFQNNMVQINKILSNLCAFIMKTQPDPLKDLNHFFYVIDNGVDGDNGQVIANYFKVGRVKYYARYVSKQAIDTQLKPDADGYYHYYLNYVPFDYDPNYEEKETANTLERKNMYVIKSLEKYEFKTKERLVLSCNVSYSESIYQSFKKESGSWTLTNIKQCLVGYFQLGHSNGSMVKPDEINIGFSNSYGARYIYGRHLVESASEELNHKILLADFGLGENDNINTVSPDILCLDTNIPINGYGSKTNISDWLDNGNYTYGQVLVGKFVENDSQIIKPTPTPTNTPAPDPAETKEPASTATTSPTSSPTSSPASSTAPLPTDKPKPGTDDKYTDISDSDTDVVHWLKMIYNRCGKQLEQIKVINTVVEKLNDIIYNQKKMIDKLVGDTDNNDIVKYLKKIYRILVANFVENVIDDLMSYVTDFVSNVGNTVADVADTAYSTASKTFPLSIIFIPKIVFDTVAAEPKTPYKKFSFDKPAGKIAGVNVPEVKFEFVIDLKQFNDLAALCRNCIVIVFLFGMVNYTTEIIAMINDVGGAD